MKRWALAVVMLALVATLMTTGSASAEPAPAPVSESTITPLRAEGRWMVDGDNRVVLMHGVNNVDKSAPYMELDDGFTLDALDADLLVEHGFNTVRLGVEFAGLMPTRGDVDEAYLDRIATVVDILGEAGIYVLLDHHQDSMSELFVGGNGFPAWAVSPHPFPNELDIGWPLNSATMISLNLAWTNFWNNTNGVVDELGNAFEALATRVRGNPAVLGIEVINEPWPGIVFPTCIPLGCPLFDAQYQAVHQRLTDSIHAGDPSMNVFWEPHVMWNQLIATHLGQPPFSPAITDPRVIFSFHDYCLFSEASIYLGLPPELVGVCDVQHDVTYLNYDNFAARSGIPAMITEFGGTGDPEIVARTMSRADKRFLGWQYWHYASSFGPEPSADPFAGELGRQLVRTYPQATAGIPKSMAFDPVSGDFAYTYTPRAATAPTAIYISDLQYADGYAVAVSGACAVSEPGAPILALRALPGADTVDVQVTSGSAPWPTCDEGTPVDAGDVDAMGSTAIADVTNPGSGENTIAAAAGGRLPATGGTMWPMLPAALVALVALATRRVADPRRLS